MAILTAIVMTQRWALKNAKKEGSRETQDSTRAEQIKAAHDKIRVITMRVEELEKTAAKDEERHETFTKSQDEMKIDIKAILAAVQTVANSVSHLEGRVDGGNGK